MKPKSPLNIPKIRFNAEFQRLIWLNFSIPLLLIIIAIYGFFCYNASSSSLDLKNFDTVGYAGVFLSSLSLILILQRSFKQDIQSQFWDQIRMSTLTVWQVVWTRLFIAPLLAWISIIIALSLIYFGIYNKVHHDPDPALWMSEYFNNIAWIIGNHLLLIIGGASIFIINELQFKRSDAEWNGSYVQLALGFGICMILGNYLLEFNIHALYWQMLINGDFNFPYVFSILSLATIIALMGLYRSMAYKMHLKSSHKFWLIATLIAPFLFLMIDITLLPSQFSYFTYMNGEQQEFVIDHNTLYGVAFLTYSAIIYGGISIISLLTQDNRTQTLVTAWNYLNTTQWRKGLDILPTWVIALPLSILSMLINHVFSVSIFTIEKHNTDWYVNLFLFLGFFLVLFVLQRFTNRFSNHFNRITLAMIGFLIVYLFSTPWLAALDLI